MRGVHPRDIKEDDILKSELKPLAVPTIIPGHPRYKQVVQSQGRPLPRKRVPEIKQTYPVPAKKKKSCVEHSYCSIVPVEDQLEAVKDKLKKYKTIKKYASNR
ncbi:uncharacterized protein LOC143248350 [Tachypleus tridentatus]|uniref:uncharacterized protein LOC143248350 n=1 Tax=Tachypleus tridentatus TaxID=6853 RepID=UPI003FD511CB